MKRILITTIPIVTLALFILVMNSDSYLKRSFGKNDNVPGSIQLVIQDVKADNWEEANKKLEQLSKAWSTIVTRVQFSAEKDELNAFDMNIARLNGAIAAKDKPGALMELNEAYEHWDNIGK
jgi:hypothetical protein